jgi:TrmH family RNA methyltransferase
MLSKNQIKRYAKLKQKKFRELEGLYLAEGAKLVEDLIRRGAEAECIAVREGVQSRLSKETLSAEEFEKLSALDNPSGVLGVFKKNAAPTARSSWNLMLDGVRDPGNMGTLVRTADWFGLHRIVCSPDTVDCFNPKAVQASMGSIHTVSVEYSELAAFIDQERLPVYGTFMKGADLSQADLPAKGILVMGNEGQGIRPAILPHITNQLSIAGHPKSQAESLNVATAAAICMAALPIRM